MKSILKDYENEIISMVVHGTPIGMIEKKFSTSKGSVTNYLKKYCPEALKFARNIKTYESDEAYLKMFHMDTEPLKSFGGLNDGTGISTNNLVDYARSAYTTDETGVLHLKAGQNYPFDLMKTVHPVLI